MYSQYAQYAQAPRLSADSDSDQGIVVSISYQELPGLALPDPAFQVDLVPTENLSPSHFPWPGPEVPIDLPDLGEVLRPLYVPQYIHVPFAPPSPPRAAHPSTSGPLIRPLRPGQYPVFCVPSLLAVIGKAAMAPSLCPGAAALRIFRDPLACISNSDIDRSISTVFLSACDDN